MKLICLRGASLLAVAALFAGCSEKGAPAGSDAGKVTHEIRGLVRAVDATAGTLTVEHEDVPGFMPSMTMPFRTKDPALVSGVKVGDAIAFDFAVTADDSWIQAIRPIDAASLQLPARAAMPAQPAAAARLKEGDQLPELRLVDQAGRPLTKDTFAGKTLLLTFIFTRCPVPNYCPLMSRNFEKIAGEVRRAPALAESVQLLSISFDPEFDTPEMLARYGRDFTSDDGLWRFATGEPGEIDQLTRAFSVYVQPESGTISHGLCTALVGPDGTIRKLWRGNAWQTSEVMAELNTVASSPSASIHH